MRIVLTCGPSYEPIDSVRRITNFSTGELGGLLAWELVQAGHDVLCFKGVIATDSRPGVACLPFTTNDDLLEKLAAVTERESVGAVFQIAALCDYRVQRVEQGGVEVHAQKLASRGGALTLTLEPATKLISRLRELFPNAQIVGWKYELEGSPEEAIAKAHRQIVENDTDACVVNGAAFGTGFGWCQQGLPVQHFADKASLCAWITGSLPPAS